MNEFVKFKLFISCGFLLMSSVLLWNVRTIRIHLFWKVVFLLPITAILWNVLIWGYHS